MHKLAIFVEGQTELLFVERFVKEIAGRHNVTVETCEARGGGKSESRKVTILRAADAGGEKYYVLIRDSGNHEKVASDIRDNDDTLVREGHSCVLALRDVHPLPRERIPAMRDAMEKVFRRCKIPVRVILSVMEIEAWFIGEYSHFARIDERITLENASRVIGKDVETVDVESIDKPAATLTEIYALGRRPYSKRKGPMLGTIEALDLAEMYLALPDRIPALKTFCDHIDEFLRV